MRWLKFRTSWLIQCFAYRGYHEDVSPIDDSPDQSQQELLHDARDTSPQAPRSHIPTMRREKQSDAVQHPWEAVPSAIRGPTAGRPEFGLTTTVTGPQVHRSGNPATTFGQRMRQLTRGKTEPVESRPPWNGASGRAPLVEPVRDDLAAPPLNIGRRNSKRGARTGGVSPETSNTAAATVRRLLPSRSNQKLKETSKTPSPEPSSHMAPSHAYPSPPYNDSPISQSHPPALASHPAQIPPRLAPNLPDPNKAIRRKPSPSTHVQSHNPHHSTSSSVYTAYTDQSVATYVPHLSTAAPTSPFTAEDPWVPPPSRFSVTTCNTVIPDSPRSIDEDRPPMPPMPPAQQQLPSVMDRRRPVPGNESAKSPTDEPIVISIKSTLSSSKAGADRANADRPISITSTTKALPLAPPEMQSANDRVAYLNARLESLAHRRTNINRGIKQMTELMPTDNLMSSTEVLRKREIEKQKVEDLKEELSEIQREEYDLGLKLYRANKRLERESDFEGSALWMIPRCLGVNSSRLRIEDVLAKRRSVRWTTIGHVFTCICTEEGSSCVLVFVAINGAFVYYKANSSYQVPLLLFLAYRFGTWRSGSRTPALPTPLAVITLAIRFQRRAAPATILETMLAEYVCSGPASLSWCLGPCRLRQLRITVLELVQEVGDVREMSQRISSRENGRFCPGIHAEPLPAAEGWPAR
ncbi:hypothetical protein AUP68_12560 [Ilyonectria robusta]